MFYWGGENLITGNDGSRQPVATMSESVLGIRPLVLAIKNCLSERSRGSSCFSGSFYRELRMNEQTNSISSISLLSNTCCVQLKDFNLWMWFNFSFVLKCNLCLSLLLRLKSHKAHRIMKSLRSSTPWGKGIISERRPSSGAVFLQSPSQFSCPHFNPISITFWYTVWGWLLASLQLQRASSLSHQHVY